MTEKLSAVVLAGGKVSPEWEAKAGVHSRGLVPFHGRPMVWWVLDALRESGVVDEIVLVGDAPEGYLGPSVEPGVNFLGSLKNGVEAVRRRQFLQVTADIPFLTPEAVREFAEQSVALNCDIAYAIIPVEECDRKFPGIRRTSLRLKEGQFTGGNIGLVRRDYITDRFHHVEAAYAARKKPLKLASMIGFDFLGRVALSRFAPSLLSIPYAEQRVSRLVGGDLRAVITRQAEVGADIDSLEQWEQFQALPFPIRAGEITP